LFVLLTILFTFFVFWVEFQRYCGGGSGGCGWVVGVVVVERGVREKVGGRRRREGGNWWYCDVK
jgi:hypothetical protein